MSSESNVEVVRLGALEKHPNADTLSVTMVHGGYPCIVRTEEWREGDLAVYVPVDSVVPDVPAFAFLRGHNRIRAQRLRGIFSMGLLVKPEPGMVKGENVGERLGITKWEAPEPGLPGTPRGPGLEAEAPPKGYVIPCYTDIEGLRRHRGALAPGEEVVITEKIHGANARYMHDGERLWVGSRTELKRESDGNMWWRVARELNLAEKLAYAPMRVVYGELYGQVQDLKYGVSGFAFRAFDVFSVEAGRYLDHDEAFYVAHSLGIEWVPQIYRGPWDSALVSHAEGPSTLAPHVREGIVIKPVRERHEHMGRVILKQHGEGYLTRKGAK